MMNHCLDLSNEPQTLEQVLSDCKETLKYCVRTGQFASRDTQQTITQHNVLAEFDKNPSQKRQNQYFVFSWATQKPKRSGKVEWKKISILRRISKWGIRIFLAGNRQRLSESLAKYFTLYEMADEPWMMTKSMMLFYQALYYHSLNPTLHWLRISLLQHNTTFISTPHLYPMQAYCTTAGIRQQGGEAVRC